MQNGGAYRGRFDEGATFRCHGAGAASYAMVQQVQPNECAPECRPVLKMAHLPGCESRMLVEIAVLLVLVNACFFTRRILGSAASAYYASRYSPPVFSQAQLQLCVPLR